MCTRAEKIARRNNRLLLVSLALAVAGAHFSLMDGLHGEAMAMLFGEDTIYASHYESAKFRQVKKGMTPAMVQRLLGEPLFAFEDAGKLTYAYTSHSENNAFRGRDILFSNGKVSKKIARLVR